MVHMPALDPSSISLMVSPTEVRIGYVRRRIALR